jgi:aminoglycoside phosphotransferase (APT) family kinase protein
VTTRDSPRIAAEDLPQALESIAQRHIPGAAQARIRNWTAPERGFSTETFLFDLVGVSSGLGGARDDTVGLVFRRPPEYQILPDYDLRRQYLTMQRLADSAIPVPTVRWIDPTPQALGTPYFVMDRIDDTITVSDFPPYHQAGIFAEIDDAGRATMWNGCVDMIAEVHRIDPAAHRLGFLGGVDGAFPPQALAGFLRHAINWAYSGTAMHPTLRRALDWLDAHPYTPDRVAVCWGDSRMSNVLYSHDLTPVAALDWEIAYLGDPAADVAWLLMTDWVSSPLPDRRPAPGTPGREETIERYERVSGHPLRNMRFSDLTAPLLLAVALIRLSERLAMPDVDLADICAQRVEFILDGD